MWERAHNPLVSSPLWRTTRVEALCRAKKERGGRTSEAQRNPRSSSRERVWPFAELTARGRLLAESELAQSPHAGACRTVKSHTDPSYDALDNFAQDRGPWPVPSPSSRRKEGARQEKKRCTSVQTDTAPRPIRKMMISFFLPSVPHTGEPLARIWCARTPRTDGKHCTSLLHCIEKTAAGEAGRYVCTLMTHDEKDIDIEIDLSLAGSGCRFDRTISGCCRLCCIPRSLFLFALHIF